MQHTAISKQLRTPQLRTLVMLALVTLALLTNAVGAPVASAQTPELAAENVFEFMFETDAEGWTGDFADLPADFDQSTFELDSGFQALPEGLDGNGFYIQGHNRSDDLFMYLKRQVDGLQPSTEYQITIEIELATNVPGGSFGIGGSPGESVFVKAGASANEPTQAPDTSGWLRSNIDKGNQSNGGSEMVVIGNVSHPEVVGDEYKIKTLTNERFPSLVTTDSNGSVWLIVGTDSGFEGLTSLYYSRISYKFVANQTPSVSTVTGTITYRERIALTPDAVVEVKLLDVSRADASSITIGEQIIANPGQVPIAFEIEYDPADIDERFSYAIGVRITEGGELSFINDTRYSVITNGSPTHVDMVLVKVGATPSEPTTPPDVGGIVASIWLLLGMAGVGILLIVLGFKTLKFAYRRNQ